jgi:hypothetical protein
LVETVRLYLDEREVGRLVDGQVETGQASSTEYPAHVDERGAIVSGPKFAGASQQRTLGRLSDDGKTILRGYEYQPYDPVGSYDADGGVYVGTGFDRRRIGRTDPPSGIGAACLLLALAAEEIDRKPPDSADKAAKAVGIAAGAATLGVEMGIKHWWRNRNTAQAKRTAASPGSSAPPPPADPTPKASPEPQAPREDTRPGQPVWAPRDKSFWEIVADENAHPGTYLQNEERVPGAVTHQATPEPDIVQPNPAFSAEPRVFFGDDPRADAEARSILDHMRTFVSRDAIDDKDGIGWAYERRYVTLQDIRGAYKNYLNIRDQVHRFMTRPGE